MSEKSSFPFPLRRKVGNGDDVQTVDLGNYIFVSQNPNDVSAYDEEFRVRNFEASAISGGQRERVKSVCQSLANVVQIHAGLMAKLSQNFKGHSAPRATNAPRRQ